MNVIVIGASGYVGAELIGLLIQHDKISIQHLLVSENSDVVLSSRLISTIMILMLFFLPHHMTLVPNGRKPLLMPISKCLTYLVAFV